MKTAITELNIIIAGVGGQGVILLSELLGNAAVEEGINVRGSEVLGMAQRGGSVFSNIRLGSEVYAPITTDGQCDILISLEPSEALRNARYLNRHSIVIYNTRKVVPATVSLGKSSYPEIVTVSSRLKEICREVIELDAVAMAEQAGNRQSANVVMLGALFGTGEMPISVETVKGLIRLRFNTRAVAINFTAFDLGCEAVKKSRENK